MFCSAIIIIVLTYYFRMADVADEAISVSPAEGGSRDNDVELQDISNGASNEMAVVEAANNDTVIEECVCCVITDETSTDWAKSRFSYSLPLSSDAKDLYSGVAHQAGQ